MAVSLMCEMTEYTAKILISWSKPNKKDTVFPVAYPTPTKPYIDELYLLCATAIYIPYMAWRRNRPDAILDLKLFIDKVFTSVFEKFKNEYPYKFASENQQDFLYEIYDAMDLTYKEFEVSMRETIINVEAEMKKQRSNNRNLSNDELEMFAFGYAEKPFYYFIVKRLFGVDGYKEPKVFNEYSGYAGQVFSLINEQSQNFIKRVKRL